VIDDSEGIKKRIDDVVIKKRFDDAYRTLLAISGIFAFAFSNYALEPFSTFIYKIGIPFILTAVIIWPVSNILNKNWEYKVKFIGFFLAWYATIGLFSIVYFKNLVGSFLGFEGWLFAENLVTIMIIPVVGSVFVRAEIITKRFTIFMIAIAVFICLGSYFILTM
jgi:hypothetical protein